jgi:hypothetical protein
VVKTRMHENECRTTKSAHRERDAIVIPAESECTSKCTMQRPVLVHSVPDMSPGQHETSSSVAVLAPTCP